jgi:hypothetical protein
LTDSFVKSTSPTEPSIDCSTPLLMPRTSAYLNGDLVLSFLPRVAAQL